MGDDERDLEFRATMPGDRAAPPEAHASTLPAQGTGPLELDATLAAGSAIPILGYREPAARPSHGVGSKSFGRFADQRSTRLAHGLVMALALAGVVNTLCFAARFLLSASPPTLHPAFLGGQPATAGAFSSTSIFQGPLLTLSRTLIIAFLFLGIALWVARRNRRELTAQVVSAFAIICAQFSISIAVLTSSEEALLWRGTATVWHMLMPVGALLLMTSFPNGKAVPSWSRKLLLPALIPFFLQTVNMYVNRKYSVPVSAVGMLVGVMFLGFQRHRYKHHATPREQRQIKWVTYATISFLAIQVVAIVAILPLLRDVDRPGFQLLKLLYEFLLLASYLVALASMLSSAARYRLWDIDRVINRTIVYVLSTSMLGGVFILLFFGGDALLRGALGAPASVSIAVPILLTAAAFLPTRRKVARLIDRRVYGIGLDYEALATKAIRAVTLPTKSTEFAHYDELVLLGRGGMGAVYRAHHPDFGVPVALKVMSPQLAEDPGAQARFRREAEMLAELNHPNIIPFLASGHDHGLAFLAMQYVEGEDLEEVRRRNGRLSYDEALHVIDGIAAALDASHAQGIIHRDVKPANVLLEGSSDEAIEKRRAHLMDFGVACRANSDDDKDSVVGSLPYLAPEQIQHPADVDPRADIYALGATAYELLTGRPPFQEYTALGYVMAHLRRPPEDPRKLEPTIPASASTAILTALAKSPAERFTSASAFAAALRGSASSESEAGSRPSPSRNS